MPTMHKVIIGNKLG